MEQFGNFENISNEIPEDKIISLDEIFSEAFVEKIMDEAQASFDIDRDINIKQSTIIKTLIKMGAKRNSPYSKDEITKIIKEVLEK